MRINRQHSSLSPSSEVASAVRSKLASSVGKKVSKKPAQVQETPATTKVDPSSYGDFLAWGRGMAARALLHDGARREKQVRLSDEKKTARATLNDRLEALAEDNSKVVAVTKFLSDYLAACDLWLESELTRLLRTAHESIIPVIVEMLLLTKSNFHTGLAKALENKENKKVHRAVISFLRSCNEAYLEDLFFKILPTNARLTDALAHSLLLVRDKDFVLEHLIRGWQALREDEIKRRYVKVKEPLIVSVIRLPRTDVPKFDHVAELYKTSTDEGTLSITRQLLIDHHKDLAASVFLEVAKDSKGVTPKKITSDSGDSSHTVRYERYRALLDYTRIARRDALLGLRDLLLSDCDASIVTCALELLLTKQYLGALGQGAITDAIDEDVKNDRQSLALACLANAVGNKDYKDFEDSLKTVFSRLTGMAAAFRNLDGVWLCEVEAKDKFPIKLCRRSTQDIVGSIGLKKLVSWMASGDPILVRNATGVFKLAGDKGVLKFISSECCEAKLLRKWLGTKDFGEKVDHT